MAPEPGFLPKTGCFVPTNPFLREPGNFTGGSHEHAGFSNGREQARVSFTSQVAHPGFFLSGPCRNRACPGNHRNRGDTERARGGSIADRNVRTTQSRIFFRAIAGIATGLPHGLCPHRSAGPPGSRATVWRSPVSRRES